MRRVVAMLLLLAGTLASSGVVAAQSGSPEPITSPDVSPAVVPGTSPAASPSPVLPEVLCDLWSRDEVTAALGGERLRAAPVGEDAARLCAHQSPRNRRAFTGFAAQLVVLDQPSFTYGDQTVGSLGELIQLNYPDSTETQIAGLPALQRPTERLVREARGWTSSSLYVFLDRITALALTATAPRGVDVQATLQGLAELAVPRLLGQAGPAQPAASMPPLSSPAPSLEADAGAGSPFLTEVRGEPISVVVDQTGQEWLDNLRPPTQLRRQLTRALRSQGKTLADLRFQVLQPPSRSLLIMALTVDGANVRQLVRPLTRMFPLDPSDAQVGADAVAGKEVTLFEDFGGSIFHAYPSGDVLWLVVADGEDLTEVFEQLP